MALFERDAPEEERENAENFDNDQPGVVAVPGLGGLSLGTAGVGLGGLPVGPLTDTEGALSEENADHNLTDSPDQYSGGGATTPGHDANADVLDR
ncbi:MAG: hypothetical protein M3328_07070 [Chloroflexota bacterium]|nr:hypothetical protein [Chloroflexota bacterium]